MSWHPNRVKGQRQHTCSGCGCHKTIGARCAQCWRRENAQRDEQREVMRVRLEGDDYDELEALERRSGYGQTRFLCFT